MLNKICITDFGNWAEYKRPFKHYRATDVLSTELYLKISQTFLSFQNNEHALGKKYRLSKGNMDYDALMLGINSELSILFEPFFSEDFLKSVATFLSQPFLPRIEGGLHSNLKNSRTGWIHNDFCSAWFNEDKGLGTDIIFPDRDACDYFSGKRKTPTASPKEYVRSATLIFYLCNDGWKYGDGGETALYGSNRMTLNTVSDLVPPINNSLLLFECSPHSYHRFVTNPGLTRNSIILWLHSTVAYAESIWGKTINHIKEK